MKVIGIISTILATLIVLPIWRGFVLAKLWAWFVVTTFGQVALNIPQAIGVSLIVSFLTYQYNTCENKEKSIPERMGTSLTTRLLSPAFILLIGWVVKEFLG